MVDALRAAMNDNGIDWFVIFSQDPHLSEYTAQCDKYREFYSHFTGSAGTLLVGIEEAYLWTDSRYFIQAEHELEGSGITLMRQGMPGVPVLYDFLCEHIWEGQKIAFDLMSISFASYERLQKRLPESVEITDGGKILKSNAASIGKREFKKIVAVPEKYAGRRVAEKLSDIRKRINKNIASDKSYSYIISDLTSVMWTFNLRGGDIEYVPVAYAYAVITGYGATLYLGRRSLSDEAQKALDDEGIVVKEYSLFYKDLDDIATDIVIADPDKNNSRILSVFANRGDLARCSDAAIITKYIKNKAETEGMRDAHLKDAVTMIKFIKTVKESAANGTLGDEYTTGKMLDDARIAGGSCCPSFETICAYGKNSAIVHYTAKEGTAGKLESKSFLLVDSGGQYKFTGTTDITRTILLGSATDEERSVYTAVLKGNLRLMDTVFPEGYKGALLDGIAEQPLWEKGYFCGHGIGHGVGHYLSVHESEARISRASSEGEAAIRTGVIVSNEPGVYIEGKFGVRLENLLLTVSAKSIDGNRMCKFEPLTLVPFDKDAIDFKELSEKEIGILKKYYGLIWEKVSPLLDEDDRKWLKETIDIK